MVKTFAKIAGIALLVAGIAGFLAPGLLGMHLTVIHDVIHLVTGGLAVYFGFQGSARGARLFSIVFGAVYLLVALLGFVAPALLAAILGHEGAVTAHDLLPDNLVHVVLGGAFLAVGLAARKEA